MAPPAKRPRRDAVDANGKPLNRKRFLKFLKSHELKFALEPVARDEATGDVTLAVCRFCQHFGREQRPDKKRRSTKNVKYFRNSFRTDQYQQHHELSHTQMWARYQECSDEDKRRFFPLSDGPAAVAIQQDALQPPKFDLCPGEVWAMEPTLEEKSRCFDVAPAVLELVAVLAIGDTEPTVENIVQKRSHRLMNYAHEPKSTAVARWSPPENTFESCMLVGTVAEPMYRVVLHSRSQLDCVVELAAAGLSFRQMSSVLRSFRVHAPAILGDAVNRKNGAAPSDIEKLLQGNLQASPQYSEEQTAEFLRLIIAMSMSVTSRLLRECWAFSLELRAAMQHAPDRSYLEFRVKVYGGGAMHNVHLISVPSFERKCKIMMFETLERVLSALLPSWRQRLLGVAIDGDAQMPPQVLNIVSRLQQEASNPIVYRSTSGCHKLNRIVENFYSSLQGGCFLLLLKELVTYIRTQPDLVVHMGGEGPSLPPCSTGSSCTSKEKWLALGIQTNWITAHRHVLYQHLEQVKPASAPDNSWWLFFAAVNWVASRVNETFTKMLRNNATTTDQVTALTSLAKDLAAAFHAQSPMGDPILTMSAPPSIKMFTSRQGRFALSKPNMLAFTREIDQPSVHMMEITEEPMVDLYAENVAMCAVNMIEALEDLSTTLGNELSLGTAGNFKVTEFQPPTLPNELAKLSGREFASLLQTYGQSVRSFLSDEDIDIMDQELQSLRRGATRESVLSAALANYNDEMTFEEAWAPTERRFKKLQGFAGGFASVFTCDPIATSGSTTDLPLCRSEMATAKVLDTDFALEGALHAQQFPALIALNEKIDEQVANGQ